MSGNCYTRAALAVLLALPMSTVAFAGDDFPIAGTYMQNRPCKGDGTDAKALLVTIRPDVIEYHGGTCTLTDVRRDGNKISMRATCKGRSSGTVLSGDISFTIREDQSLEMVDQDKNYHTILYRCPR